MEIKTLRRNFVLHPKREVFDESPFLTAGFPILLSKNHREQQPLDRFLDAMRPEMITQIIQRQFFCVPSATNEHLEMLFPFRFRNGKAQTFPQMFFRFHFRNDHVGHAQATTAGLTYEINENPRDFLSLSLS